MLDVLKSKMFFERKKKMIKYGFENGLIRPYDDELIKKFREVYYGGIPASILLLTLERCNHKCFDRSVLAAACLDDFEFAIYGIDIDSIRLHPQTLKDVAYCKKNKLSINPTYARHSVVIFKRDGYEWVLDTTDGLVYYKDFYFKLENAKVMKVNDKEATQAFCEYQDIRNADINRDKYVLPSMLPTYEALAPNSPYYSRLLEEIKLFKEKVGYEEICEEILADKRSKGWNV